MNEYEEFLIENTYCIVVLLKISFGQ
ncbi:hypothetical protein TKK_0003346 [Trichogramma kaykai]